MAVGDTLPLTVYLPHRPSMAVSTDGTLAMTWQAPRAELGNKCFQLVFAASSDGGRTFTAPVPVAAVPACNEVPGNALPLSDGRATSRRFGDGGDYHGLVALPDGTFQALWADSRSGVYQLWSARIRLGSQ